MSHFGLAPQVKRRFLSPKKAVSIAFVPKKISPESNGKLHFTLPKGARELLDQLVETQEVGGSHAEVVRYLIQTQLQTMLKEGTLLRRKPEG
jgi:hypothetical protein